MTAHAQSGKVIAVNTSLKKGVVKKPVEQITLDFTGVTGDAHAGEWHRQVSLLGQESADKFTTATGKKVSPGDFAENITTSGLALHLMQPLDRLLIGDAELELTQIGKKCHGKTCAIYKETGDCVMPKEGIFCRVIKPGIVRPGDEIKYLPKTYNVSIITLSDRASHGIYKDLSGPAIKELLKRFFNKTIRKVRFEMTIIPDDQEKLSVLISLAASKQQDIVITTGGTGLGSRDITIETIVPLLDKQIPGIMEFIRIKYGTEKPKALVSRSVAGVIGKTLVFCLPGSVKAVEEYIHEITVHIDHLLYMLNDLDIH